MSRKDKKYGTEQILFVDELLKIYGINGLCDYDSKINQDSIDQNKLKKINDYIIKFKKIFPTKEFNLSRKDFKIDTPSFAILFLRNLLNHIGMSYDIFRIK